MPCTVAHFILPFVLNIWNVDELHCWYLTQAVWLCPNEVSVKGFLSYQIWCLEARHRDMWTETRRITVMSSHWIFPNLDMQIEGKTGH